MQLMYTILLKKLLLSVLACKVKTNISILLSETKVQ